MVGKVVSAPRKKKSETLSDAQLRKAMRRVAGGKFWKIVGIGAVGRAIQSAASDRELRAAIKKTREEDLFKYAAVRDLVEAFARGTGEHHSEGSMRRVGHVFRQNQQRKRAIDLLERRLHSFAHWSDQNETVQAIRRGELNPEKIRPHIRDSDDEIEEIYESQNRQLTEALQNRRKRGPDAPQRTAPLKLEKNFNHSFREPQAQMLVELLFGYLQALDTPPPIRWLDIACGSGRITNAVDAGRFSALEREIVGVDLQESRIGIAELANAEGRSFHVADAIDFMRNKKSTGEVFHIVSMFEFLEHLTDPLGFLNRLQELAPTFVIAGSPLEQKLDKPFDSESDNVHLWSYSREGWEEMFRLAGFNPIYSSEARVGSYVGGLDWLTIICGPVDQIRARRKNLFESGDS